MQNSESKSKSSNNLTDSGFTDFYSPLPDSRRRHSPHLEFGNSKNPSEISPKFDQDTNSFLSTSNQKSTTYLEKKMQNMPPLQTVNLESFTQPDFKGKSSPNKENQNLSNFSKIPPFERNSSQKYFTDQSGEKYYGFQFNSSSQFPSQEATFKKDNSSQEQDLRGEPHSMKTESELFSAQKKDIQVALDGVFGEISIPEDFTIPEPNMSGNFKNLQSQNISTQRLHLQGQEFIFKFQQGGILIESPFKSEQETPSRNLDPSQVQIENNGQKLEMEISQNLSQNQSNPHQQYPQRQKCTLNSQGSLQHNHHGIEEDPMTFKKEPMKNFNQKFSNPFYGESLSDSDKLRMDSKKESIPRQQGIGHSSLSKKLPPVRELRGQNGARISFNHQGISNDLLNKLNHQFMGYLNSEQDSLMSGRNPSKAQSQMSQKSDGRVERFQKSGKNSTKSKSKQDKFTLDEDAYLADLNEFDVEAQLSQHQSRSQLHDTPQKMDQNSQKIGKNEKFMGVSMDDFDHLKTSSMGQNFFSIALGQEKLENGSSLKNSKLSKNDYLGKEYAQFCHGQAKDHPKNHLQNLQSLNIQQKPLNTDQRALENSLQHFERRLGPSIEDSFPKITSGQESEYFLQKRSDSDTINPNREAQMSKNTLNFTHSSLKKSKQSNSRKNEEILRKIEELKSQLRGTTDYISKSIKSNSNSANTSRSISPSHSHISNVSNRSNLQEKGGKKVSDLIFLDKNEKNQKNLKNQKNENFEKGLPPLVPQVQVQQVDSIPVSGKKSSPKNQYLEFQEEIMREKSPSFEPNSWNSPKGNILNLRNGGITMEDYMQFISSRRKTSPKIKDSPSSNEQFSQPQADENRKELGSFGVGENFQAILNQENSQNLDYDPSSPISAIEKEIEIIQQRMNEAQIISEFEIEKNQKFLSSNGNIQATTPEKPIDKNHEKLGGIYEGEKPESASKNYKKLKKPLLPPMLKQSDFDESLPINTELSNVTQAIPKNFENPKNLENPRIIKNPEIHENEEISEIKLIKGLKCALLREGDTLSDLEKSQISSILSKLEGKDFTFPSGIEQVPKFSEKSPSQRKRAQIFTQRTMPIPEAQNSQHTNRNRQSIFEMTEEDDLVYSMKSTVTKNLQNQLNSISTNPIDFSRYVSRNQIVQKSEEIPQFVSQSNTNAKIIAEGPISENNFQKNGNSHQIHLQSIKHIGKRSLEPQNMERQTFGRQQSKPQLLSAEEEKIKFKPNLDQSSISGTPGRGKSCKDIIRQSLNEKSQIENFKFQSPQSQNELKIGSKAVGRVQTSKEFALKTDTKNEIFRGENQQQQNLSRVIGFGLSEIHPSEEMRLESQFPTAEKNYQEDLNFQPKEIQFSSKFAQEQLGVDHQHFDEQGYLLGQQHQKNHQNDEVEEAEYFDLQQQQTQPQQEYYGGEARENIENSPKFNYDELNPSLATLMSTLTICKENSLNLQKNLERGDPQQAKSMTGYKFQDSISKIEIEQSQRKDEPIKIECFLYTFFTQKLKKTLQHIFKNGDQDAFLKSEENRAGHNHYLDKRQILVQQCLQYDSNLDNVQHAIFQEKIQNLNSQIEFLNCEMRNIHEEELAKNDQSEHLSTSSYINFTDTQKRKLSNYTMLLKRRLKKLAQINPTGKYLQLLRPRERYTILGWDDELIQRAIRKQKILEEMTQSETGLQNPMYLNSSPSTPKQPLDQQPEIQHESTTKFKPISSNLINFKFEKIESNENQRKKITLLDEKQLMLKRKFIRLYQETVMKIPIEQEIRCKVKELWELAASKRLPETKWIGLIHVFIDQNTKFLKFQKKSRSRSRSKPRSNRNSKRKGKWIKNSLVSRSFSSMSTKSVNLKRKGNFQKREKMDEYGITAKRNPMKKVTQSQINITQNKFQNEISDNASFLTEQPQKKRSAWQRPKSGSSLRSIVEKVQISARQEYRDTLKKNMKNVNPLKMGQRDTFKVNPKPKKYINPYMMTPQWGNFKSSQVELQNQEIEEKLKMNSKREFEQIEGGSLGPTPQRILKNQLQGGYQVHTTQSVPTSVFKQELAQNLNFQAKNFQNEKNIENSNSKEFNQPLQLVPNNISDNKVDNFPSKVEISQNPPGENMRKIPKNGPMMFKDQYGNLYRVDNNHHKLIERNGKQYILMKKRYVKGPSQSPTPKRQSQKNSEIQNGQIIEKHQKQAVLYPNLPGKEVDSFIRNSIFESHKKSQTPESQQDNIEKFIENQGKTAENQQKKPSPSPGQRRKWNKLVTQGFVSRGENSTPLRKNLPSSQEIQNIPNLKIQNHQNQLKIQPFQPPLALNQPFQKQQGYQEVTNNLNSPPKGHQTLGSRRSHHLMQSIGTKASFQQIQQPQQLRSSKKTPVILHPQNGGKFKIVDPRNVRSSSSKPIFVGNRGKLSEEETIRKGNKNGSVEPQRIKERTLGTFGSQQPGIRHNFQQNLGQGQGEGVPQIGIRENAYFSDFSRKGISGRNTQLQGGGVAPFGQNPLTGAHIVDQRASKRKYQVFGRNWQKLMVGGKCQVIVKIKQFNIFGN